MQGAADLQDGTAQVATSAHSAAHEAKRPARHEWHDGECSSTPRLQNNNV